MTTTRWTPRRIARGLKRRAHVALRRETPTFDRRAVLLDGVTRDMRVLEIGPSYAPLAPRSEGWDVCVVDHATREELVEKYGDPAHRVDVTRIEDVDVVWREGSLDEAVGTQRLGFDVCLASHVIEHTPDFVGFVQGVMRSLAPNGWLSLAVPDLRYCFDLLRGPTRGGELVEAHVRGASRHRLATAFDQVAYTVRKGGNIAWDQAETGRIEPVASLAIARDVLTSHDDGASAEYVDAHVWRFTPASFELTILELSALGLLDVHLTSLHPTVGCEFFVQLRPGARLPSDSSGLDAVRLELLERSVREVADVWAKVGA